MKRLLSHTFLFSLLIAACLTFSPRDTQSAENTPWVHQVRVGVLDHDTNNLWSGSNREAGVDFNTELIFTPNYELWHGLIRPNLGLSINSQGDTSKVYAGGVWEYLWRNGVIVDIGAGLAAHNGEIKVPEELDRKGLGSRILLHFSAELGYSLSTHNRIFLMVDHISNGYLTEPNEGLDTIGLRYGYQF